MIFQEKFDEKNLNDIIVIIIIKFDEGNLNDIIVIIFIKFDEGNPSSDSLVKRLVDE